MSADPSKEQKLVDYLKWVTADLRKARERITELESADDANPWPSSAWPAGSRAGSPPRTACGSW
ncbi:hypothetical protein SMICM17S_08899 [Streptomyces microflavus]